MNLISKISQLPPNDNTLGWLLQIVWLLVLIAFFSGVLASVIFYGQRTTKMLRTIQSDLRELKTRLDQIKKRTDKIE